MINRPSYAQRTLDLTRRSLQLLPPVPVSSDPTDAAGTGGDEVADLDAVARANARAHGRARAHAHGAGWALDLGRWRRRGAPVPTRAAAAIERRLVR